MRIAFYAPMKAPNHPTPSGDRQIARLIMTALAQAGHNVALASEFRSYEGAGDAARQKVLAGQAIDVADDLIAGYRGAPDTAPDLWLTYHLFHKAPDYLGPAVAAALDIPYVVAEASFAPKQAGGPWDQGHMAVAAALSQAAAVIYLNPVDEVCVAPLLNGGAQQIRIKPFADTTALADLDHSRGRARDELAARWSLPPDTPWLLAVGMMRTDVKRDSYQLLAAALAQLSDLPWRLLVVGDGPARAEITEAFGPVAERVAWCGEVPPDDLAAHYAAADLLVWPAVNEALGLSILEAQAAGVPAVVGDAGAVPTIVASGETGLVVTEGDTAAFARGIRELLSDPARRSQMGEAAKAKTAAEHSMAVAATRLDEVVRNAVSFRST